MEAKGMHDSLDEAKFEDGTPWGTVWVGIEPGDDDETIGRKICKALGWDYAAMKGRVGEVHEDGTPKTAAEAQRQIDEAWDEAECVSCGLPHKVCQCEWDEQECAKWGLPNKACQCRR